MDPIQIVPPITTGLQWQDGMVKAAIAVVPVILGIVAKHVVAYLKALKAKAQADAATSEKAEWRARWAEVALFVTGRVANVVLPMLQKAAADGRITKEEADVLQKALINEMRALWGDDGIKALAEAFGIPLGSLGRWAVQQVLEHYFGKYDAIETGNGEVIEYAIVTEKIAPDDMPPNVVQVVVEEPASTITTEVGEDGIERVVFVIHKEIDPNDPAYTGG